VSILRSGSSKSPGSVQTIRYSGCFSLLYGVNHDQITAFTTDATDAYSTATRKLKFLENQMVKPDKFAPGASQVIGLALEFTFQQPD